MIGAGVGFEFGIVDEFASSLSSAPLALAPSTGDLIRFLSFGFLISLGGSISSDVMTVVEVFGA